MKLDGARSCHLDPLLESHVAKCNSILVVVIDARQRSVFGEVVVRRIPHLRDGIVSVADATVDLVLVVFPEAAVRLPSELASWIIYTLIHRIAEIPCEVVFDLL